MSDFGEIVNVAFEMPATNGEITEFRNRVLWPAINFLARKDFTGSALVGEAFELGVTNAAVGKSTKTELGSYIEARYDDHVFIESHMNNRCCVATFVISKTCPEMLDSLMEAAKLTGDNEEFDGEEQGIIEAWQVTEFAFEDEPVVSKNTLYELVDKFDGEIIWDEDDMETYGLKNDDKVELDDEEREASEAIESELGDGFNQSDIMKIKEALVSLGVPADILFQD